MKSARVDRRSLRCCRNARACGLAPPRAAAAPPAPAVLPKEEVIRLSKEYVDKTARELTEESIAMLSDDFVFRGPVVGPLVKKEFVQALGMFKTSSAFPDIKSNSFGFDVDPDDPMRVWFFYKTSGTMTEDWVMGGNTMKATGRPIQNGVEAASYIWTPDGKIKYMSVGYCVDRINSSTPNGSMNVAVVGLLRAAGAEGAFALMSNPVINWVQDQFRALTGKERQGTQWEDLPAWFKELPDSKLKAGEGYK